MQLPWISRRRHEDEVHELGAAAAEVAVGLADERDEARQQRDHLAQRVADLLDEQRDVTTLHAPCRRTEDHLRSERDEAHARIGKLEQAIREHLTTDAGHHRLSTVLEGRWDEHTQGFGGAA